MTILCSSNLMFMHDKNNGFFLLMYLHMHALRSMLESLEYMQAIDPTVQSSAAGMV